MADKSVSPRRGEAFVDQNGVPLPRPMSWIEQITSLFNTNVASVTDILDDHETRIDALELPRTISTQTIDYTIASDLESGVLANMSSVGLAVTLPDATDYLDVDFFAENIGSNEMWVTPVPSQTISGVDLVGLTPNTPYPVCSVKSDGANWVLMSDRYSGDVLFGYYWSDELGDTIVDENGDEIVFA